MKRDQKKLKNLLDWARDMEEKMVAMQNYTAAMTYERVRKRIQEEIGS